jgi:UDP-GlcNAc:undecaprenyl-phosphate/decaprenyl-phosphate GlcNAc-1-phosphate transferase
MMIKYYAVAFLGSLAASLVLTPIVRAIARRTAFVDKPDGRRKLHADSVALGGGLAVLTAVLGTSVLVFGWAGMFTTRTAGVPFFVGLLSAAALLAVVGMIDDLVGLRGRYKLAGQIAACLVLVAFGLQIRVLSVFGLSVALGSLAIPVTFAWLLGTINAINLLDGADGLASTVGLLLCLTVAALGAFGHHLYDGLLAMAMAGALLGFLRYNFPPASIYLGDTGSMFVGLVIGAIAIDGNMKTEASMAFAAPLCMLAIPMLDTCAALVPRKLTGRSLFAPDRGHIHHVLLQRGCSASQTVLIIAGVCSITCLAALLSLHFRKDAVAIVTMIFVIAALAACRVFGHVEFGLVIRRLAVPWRWRLAGDGANSNGAFQTVYHLYGSRNWNDLWTALTESAENFGLIRMEFRILMPAIHESFFAVWTKPNGAAEEEQWSVRSPLFFDGQLVGNLLLAGHSRHSAILAIGEVADFLEPIEDHIRYSITDSQHLDDAAARGRGSDRSHETVQVKNDGQATTPVTRAPARNSSPSSGGGAHRSRRKHLVLPS